MALTESMFGLAADVEDDRLCRDIPVHNAGRSRAISSV